MIPITPIEGITILLDVDEIFAIESMPETVVVLVDQRRMVVSDRPESIVKNIRNRRAARVAGGGRLRISNAAPAPSSILRTAHGTGAD